MISYIDDAPVVNVQVDPAFLPRRQQAATAKPRRRISSEVWGTFRALLARDHQCLPPDSSRIKPTLPELRLREPA